MAETNAQLKATAVTAANEAVARAANGTPEQKKAAQDQLARANAMPN
jgi:hypothetical protein